MLKNPKTGIKKKLNKIAENMEKHKIHKTSLEKDIIIMEFLDYLKNASPPLSIERKKAIFTLLYSANIMGQADTDKMLSYFNLGTKNKEEFLAESKNYDIKSAYDSLPPDLQDLLTVIETSKKEHEMSIKKIKNAIMKLKDEKWYYLPSKKNNTDSFAKPRDDIIKIYNILVEIENEIKRTNKRIISLESNIVKMEGKSISKKYGSLGEGIDHLSDLSTDIYKTLLKAPSISTKEDQGVGLPIPYIISLSLSIAVFMFCSTSLFAKIFTEKTFFDPYTSLFWFFGSIGIGLMSLKGIFDWKSK